MSDLLERLVSKPHRAQQNRQESRAIDTMLVAASLPARKGFLTSRTLPLDIPDGHVVLLSASGSARAIVYGLAS